MNIIAKLLITCAALLVSGIVTVTANAGANTDGAVMQVEIPVSTDTTLFEMVTDQNMGTALTLIVGRINQNVGGRSRVLLRFDIKSAIPAGVTIQSVRMQFKVTAANNATPVSLTLHPMLRGWVDKSTWNHASHPDGEWASLGGGKGKDFSSVISGMTEIEGLAEYEFASTRRMVANVQAWLDNPTGNHGWMLRSKSEETQRSARRLISSEDPSRKGPRLIVAYTKLPNSTQQK
ncbi:MAG: DNRLRE domain-containing protein [Verrucomicrobia bacterium]|nr:DNRLRE domain-containing protein [Verrucomicrobiota bacterium]